MAEILIVDDEKEVSTFLSHLLNDKGHSMTICSSGVEFDSKIQNKEFQLAFLDVKLPDRNGLAILKTLKTVQPACKVVVMTGYATIQTAVDAIKFGANDFIEKPFDDIKDIEHLTERILQNENGSNHAEIDKLALQLNCFIGNNKEMIQVFKLAHKLAQKNIPILIEGETGTGKEILARFIHHASLRKNYPFVGINCGAISENLLESELFGHEKGAFTGATKDRKGFFQLAGKGTLFLDEIGEASLTAQVKLLRVLETGEFIKVGGEMTEFNLARIIAATHVKLENAVKNGSFREDLLYRLDVVKLTIPPLRLRSEDIPLFIEFYLQKEQLNFTFTKEALDCLRSYTWPGNIRELVNVIKRAVTFAEEETAVITADYLPERFRNVSDHVHNMNDPSTQVYHHANFEPFLRNWSEEILKMLYAKKNSDLNNVFEMMNMLEAKTTQAFIEKALKNTIGNRKKAAEELGITLRKLRYYLNEKK
ncbi:sigma-54 dependent transcriptional regulator [Robertmurraya sp. DFI.2.37]|uniref:sigma-54-dependent transcriptional regulator n=1 Tax=Robertmurraya sp. DFI.2.37 TaxID=3031819 RepID=UPI00124436E6|nr:sigma-54 dependent transcriptional regulator [Robertmurraya sp. DFI.2.37]MDF1508481.1 sigma-54 dependent transcriptional regulator [Robertmurraya sp. DFI.2.37]